MTDQKFENVEIDLPDDVFMELAKQAHKLGITLNEHMVNILHAYVEGKINLDMEAVEQQKQCDDIRNASRDICKAVTEESLIRFGYAFSDWCHNYHGDTTCRELISKGFDDADALLNFKGNR